MAAIIILTDKLHKELFAEIEKGLRAGRYACDPGAARMRPQYVDEIRQAESSLQTLLQYVHGVKDEQ